LEEISMTARHSPEAVAALIRLPHLTGWERGALIGAAATLRRGRELSPAQARVVDRVMKHALAPDRDLDSIGGFEPLGTIAARLVARRAGDAHG
jgi:hypothetical protein